MMQRKNILYQNGKDAIEAVKKIIREGNAKHIIVKTEDGKVILNLSLTLSIAGVLLAPVLAGAAAALALVKNCTIEISS